LEVREETTGAWRELGAGLTTPVLEGDEGRETKLEVKEEVTALGCCSVDAESRGLVSEEEERGAGELAVT
jgi:hypothetical protein